MERTWPDDWESRKAGNGCTMCAEGRPEVNEYRSTRVFAGQYADAYLRGLATPLGYTVVAWRGRHVSEPTELTDEEATGYWLEVLRVARGIEQLYRPAKLNIQILGNAVPHLHTHVIPRYLTDPSPGAPPDFAYGLADDMGTDEYGREAAQLRGSIQRLG